ncbi:EamA/RhaT family transporter [Dysgonomonas sp. 216]|uniref:DMT family transporter n=1 Tax=Dysgonomonas sp. 216 TaxID=2302934 RepID=UPI0013D4EFC2|nr:DMT family transporter [Dysgonomonas sp. 216]NDW19010.1 EamA/RhaT family transporter [Dysgonomonas sp. 216]
MAISQKQWGHITMFSVATMFALNIPIGKYLLSNFISPFGYTVSRILFATIAFWIASLFMKKERVAIKDHLILLGGGIFGIIFNQGLFIFGLGNTSPVDASIITTSSPLFAMIIAALILKEPITLQKAGGVLLGIAGAVSLVYSSHHGNVTTESGMIGNLSIVGSSFSYAFYLVITRPLSTRYSSVTIMKWMFLYAAIFFVPLFYKDLVNADLFKQTESLPFAFYAYVLIFATFIAYMLIPVAQKRIRPTTISMYNNLQPIIASFVAISIGQDTFSVGKLISGILVFMGVYLVTQSKSKADLDAEQIQTSKQ